MKKMRFCSVCKRYTLEKFHCNRISISAHPMPFKSLDPYGDYRRAVQGVDVITKDQYAV